MSTSHSEDIKKIIEAFPEVKPVKLDLSWRTKLMDKVLGVYSREHKPHRPIRVNKGIDQFRGTVEKIVNELYADCLPKELKNKIVETTFSLIEDFQKFSDQAMQGYGKGSKGRQSRQEGEDKIKELNEKIQKISKDLPMWKYINDFKDRIEMAPASSSNDMVLGMEQLAANKVIDELEQAHMQVIDCYRQPSDVQTQSACQEGIKQAYNQFKTLSDFSYEWRQVNKDGAQLKVDLGEATQENKQAQILADEVVKRAEDAYIKILDWYQQPNGRPEHLESACKQLNTLSDVLHVWKRVHEFQANLSEPDKKKVDSEVEAAFQQLLAHYDQVKDGQDYKLELEEAYKSLKKDLYEKLYKPVESHKALRYISKENDDALFTYDDVTDQKGQLGDKNWNN